MCILNSANKSNMNLSIQLYILNIFFNSMTDIRNFSLMEIPLNDAILVLYNRGLEKKS